jgi:hypothetical protein
MKTIFLSLSFVAVFGSGIRDPGSGMGKNQDPVRDPGLTSRIRHTAKNTHKIPSGVKFIPPTMNLTTDSSLFT